MTQRLPVHATAPIARRDQNPFVIDLYASPTRGIGVRTEIPRDDMPTVLTAVGVITLGYGVANKSSKAAWWGLGMIAVGAALEKNATKQAA